MKDSTPPTSASPSPLHAQARLVVPVIASAGGSGRSTVAGLIAGALAAYGTTAVLDTAARLSSPWPGAVSEPREGLGAIPAGLPVTRGAVQQATSQCRTGTAAWGVLTDHQEWHQAPLLLPQEPSAWHQLAAIGGWQAVVVDTHYPATHDIVTAQHSDHRGLTAAWCDLPFAVPVLCVAATHSGMHMAQQAVQAASAAGLPAQRMVVAVVDVSEGRPPAAVKAGVTMLRPRVAAVVSVPHVPRVRSHGLRALTRAKRPVPAGEELVREVLTSAAAVWGAPLPPAAQPAPLSTASVPARPSYQPVQEVAT